MRGRRRPGRPLRGQHRVWLDRLIAETPGKIADLPELWGGYGHMGTMVAHAPDLPTGIEDQVHTALLRTPDVKAAVTRLGDIVLRKDAGSRGAAAA